MSYRVPFPDHMTINNWVGAIITNIPQGNIPQLSGFSDWQTWARFTIGLPIFAKNHVPPPTKDESWQNWARRFAQTIFV